jgi:hypothetical protein
MNLRKPGAPLLLALSLAVIGAATASAQYTNPKGDPLDPQALSVTFPFQVGDKILPAGLYSIEQPSCHRRSPSPR